MTTTVEHSEPCGCRYAQADAPDDQGYGQRWALLDRCATHAPSNALTERGHNITTRED